MLHYQFPQNVKEAIEAPVKAEIEVIEKVYGGGVNLNSEGEFVADEEGHEYIGPPSKKVDDAWNRLLEGLCRISIALIGSCYYSLLSRNKY